MFVFGNDDSAVEPVEDARDQPRVVDEADEVLGAYYAQLGGSGAVAILAWAVAEMSGFGVSLLWLVAALLIPVLLFFVPVTREPRLSREVLRRWDQLRVDRALGAAGVSTDPRLEVAESMADRVIRHPSVDERTREVTKAMVVRLKRLLHDLSRIGYLTHAQAAHDRHEENRSISDLHDLLDARVADVLSQLAQLHRTVVLRDTASLEGVVAGVEDLVRTLEAEQEVDRLLSNAERE